MVAVLVAMVCLIRRLKMMLTSEQAIAALRQGAAQRHQYLLETFLFFSLRARPSLPPSLSPSPFPVAPAIPLFAWHLY